MEPDGRRYQEFPRGIDLFAYTRCEAVECKPVVRRQFGQNRHERTTPQGREALFVSRSVDRRPFVEEADPGVIWPLCGIPFRAPARKGYRIPACEAGQIAECRREDAETFAAIDVARPPEHRAE